MTGLIAQLVQSARPITVRSLVQIQLGPPFFLMDFGLRILDWRMWARGAAV